MSGAVEAGIAIATLVLVALTLGVSLYFGFRSVRSGERGARASERAAIASEEELDMLKTDAAAMADHTRPEVDVTLPKVWASTRRDTGHSVMMGIVVENRSSEPDVLRRVTVAFDDRRLALPHSPGFENLKRFEDLELPLTLSPRKPVNLHIGFTTDPLIPTEGEPVKATLTIECSNAGEVLSEFTLP